MQISLSQEDQDALQAMVSTGRFDSVEQAIHAAIVEIQQEPDATWVAYVRRAMDEGLADVEAGRTVSGDEVVAELRARRSKVA